MRFALLAGLLSFTGCEIGLHIDGLYPDEDGDEGTGGGPGDDPCFVEFDACVDQAGGDPEQIAACNDTLLQCIGVGESGGYDTGGDPDWGDSSSDGGDSSSDGGESSTGGPCDTGEPPPCELEFELCLENNPDPEICFIELEACQGGGSESGGEPMDPCQAGLDMCLQGNPDDPEACFLEFEACQGGGSESGGEPPPCEYELDQCLQSNPMDPDMCFLAFEDCQGGGSESGGEPIDPNDSCQLDLDMCLQSNPVDPDMCFLAFEDCMGGGGESGGEPPPDDCGLQFEACMQYAISDDEVLLCEEELMQCQEQQY